MALPTTGQLSYSQINVELGHGSTSQASMFAMATEASKSTTNASVSNFYGYSAGDTILLSWGTTTGLGFGEYRVVNHSGHTSPQIITINFTYDAYCDGGASIYYSKNSTSSWTTVKNIVSSSTSGSYSITNVDYNDVVRVRWSKVQVFYNFYMDMYLNNGTVTSGSGTVSGTTDWLVTP